MEFDCRRLPGSCVTAQACGAQNGTCLACLPGWVHSRGVVWADDCMTPVVFIQVVMAFACLLTAALCCIIGLVYRRYTHMVPPPQPKHATEARRLAGETLAMVLSTWLMSCCIYLGTAEAHSVESASIILAVYPWAVAGQCTAAFVIIDTLKRRIMYPAFSMNTALFDKVRRFDRRFLMVTLPVTLVNAAFSSVGAAAGRPDLFNLGETIQLTMLSSFAIITLMEVRRAARELAKTVSNALDSRDQHISQTPEMKLKRQKIRGARDTVMYVSRIAIPVLGSCVGSLALCVLSFFMGTIPFVNIWITLAIMSSGTMFTWWFKLQYWRPAGARTDASTDDDVDGSKPHAASALAAHSKEGAGVMPGSA